MAGFEPRYPPLGSTFLRFAEYTPWDLAVHLPSQGQKIPKSKPRVQANHCWSEPVSVNIEAPPQPRTEVGNIRSKPLFVDTEAAKAGGWKDPLGMSPVSEAPTTFWESEVSSPGMASDISWGDSAGVDIFEPIHSPNPGAQAPETTNRADTQYSEESSRHTQENDTSQKSNKHPITTVLVQNLLTRLKPSDLMRELDETGFAGLYNFLYMPRNFATGQGVGYAFINFVTPEDAQRFIDAWSRVRLLHIGKRLQVTEALIQGLEANIKKWVTPRMLRVKKADFRPLVFPLRSGPEEQVTLAQSPPEAAGSGLAAVTAEHVTQKARAAATAPAEA